jgi:hypothetical protein
MGDRGRPVQELNCDPGCRCDFNQAPTHGQCEGIIVMRIDEARTLEVSAGSELDYEHEL